MNITSSDLRIKKHNSFPENSLIKNSNIDDSHIDNSHIDDSVLKHSLTGNSFLQKSFPLKHNLLCKLLFIALLFVILIQATESAFAQSAPNNCPATTVAQPSKNTSFFEFGRCASRFTRIPYPEYQLTTKLVICLEGTIQSAVTRMLAVISNEFGWVTGVVATLVLIFFGVRMVSGERDLLKRGATLFVKLAFIVVFMNMLPEIVDATFAILRDFMRMVSGGVTPWNSIDRIIGNLLGFGPAITIINGLVGIVGAAIFSSTVGLVMFFFGMLAIVNLLIFIMELIYTYMLAFFIIGFMLMLAPVMIPLALFFSTERMFRKWVDIMVSAMITPVLLFAFVGVFAGVFDILLQNIFDILGGNDFRAYWRTNISLFSWLMPSDANTNNFMQNLPTNEDINCVNRNITAPVQGNIDPMQQNSFDAGGAKVASLDFGADEVSIIQRLSFAFASLWIFASLMKSMVHLIPEVAASIANTANHITFGAGSELVGKLKGGVDQTRSNLLSGMANDGKKFDNLKNISKQMANMVGVRDK